jgi:hypothetical protein
VLYKEQVRVLNDDFPYKILSSALEHGVTKRDIQYVLYPGNPTTRYYLMHDDEDGNGQEMAVGFTESERCIEIGIGYQQHTTIIFHADSITPAYKKLYKAEP